MFDVSQRYNGYIHRLRWLSWEALQELTEVRWFANVSTGYFLTWERYAQGLAENKPRSKDENQHVNSHFCHRRQFHSDLLKEGRCFARRKRVFH